MPVQDQDFIKKLQATFATEAQEHLQIISTLLLDLEKSLAPAQEAAVIESIYREAHTLKGASRAVDISSIESICQAMEGVFAAWKQQTASPSREGFDALHRTLAAIGEVLNSVTAKSGRHDQPQLGELVRHLDRLRTPATSADSAQPPKVTAAETPASIPSAVSAPCELGDAAAFETVRIATAKLDSRLLQAEDMLVVKNMAATRVVELRDLTASFEQWWKEWAKIASDVRALRRAFEQESKMAEDSRAGSGGLLSFLDWNLDYFRSLENKLGGLVAQSQQDRLGICKRVDDLLEDSKKLLMLPFSTITGMFEKIVRDLCSDQGKEADLIILGAEVGIDKRILEEMKNPLIHILRNCVDHGVEKPQERARLNKPRATITLTVCQVNGGKVEIRVSDDGAGVDVANVRKSAVSHGILSQGESQGMNDQQALSLIFHSGVSTSPIITEISGRGLGMAIVRAKTEKLGGNVSIESERHAGMTLRMTLPLTLSTFRGILVSAGGQIFVAPAVNVDRVLRVKPAEIQTVENRESISLRGRAVSLARLEAVLELPRPAKRADESALITVVVLHSADQRIAFVVDEILKEEEVLVKSFPKPLARLRNISGATVLGSGKAVPVLNVADLMKSARSHGVAPVTAEAAENQQAAPLRKVLVVEDSITSRMLLKNILETANYQVRTAVDGIDAFTALREERFDLVVSDVEMPRMNGLDLTARIRADAGLSELPIVLVTALESRSERERGIDVGANAYIIKSSFDQSNLLEVVRQLV